MHLKEFKSLVSHRQSDRKFDANKTIDPALLDEIIDTARLAPSATNSQPWSFVVVTDKELRSSVALLCGNRLVPINHFAHQANAMIIVVEERSNWLSSIGNKLQNEVLSRFDIGIVTAHLTLAAEAAGLGSCILGLFREKPLRKLLNIPESKRIALVLLLGYSQDAKRPKKRKALNDVLHHNRW